MLTRGKNLPNEAPKKKRSWFNHFPLWQNQCPANHYIPGHSHRAFVFRTKKMTKLFDLMSVGTHESPNGIRIRTYMCTNTKLRTCIRNIMLKSFTPTGNGPKAQDQRFPDLIVISDPLIRRYQIRIGQIGFFFFFILFFVFY